MGNRPTKIRSFYTKLIKKKKAVINPMILQHKKNNIFDTGYEEDIMLISTEPNLTDVNDCSISTSYLEELSMMENHTNEVIGNLRKSIDQMEHEHKKKIQKCMQTCKLSNHSSFLRIKNDNSQFIKSQIEECRLRNALISEKFKNCLEYMENYDTKFIERETKKEDNFLRKLLFKTAKRQYKKSQLNEAVETLCQLIIATSGLLNNEEMQLLFEVSKKKIAYTYQFYERITNAVKQIDDKSSKFVIDELWTSVIEDLRTECAESYDIVMKVNPEIDNKEVLLNNAQSQCNVDILKYLTATTICALWLQITSSDHDEFQDIKDLFFESLEKYIDIFLIDQNNQFFNEKYYNLCFNLQTTLTDVIQQCPVIAKSKRMNKIIQKLNNKYGIAKPNGILTSVNINEICIPLQKISSIDTLQKRKILAF